MKTYVIMLAGGRGSRMNAGFNKVLMSVRGRTVIRRSVEAFASFADDMVVVARPEEQAAILEGIDTGALPFSLHFAPGGETRQASVLNGLNAISPDPEDVILIHDAARCLVDAETIRRVIRSVTECGTGIPGIPASSTFKVCDGDSFIQYTPDRASLFEVQTPQGFTAGKIIPVARKAAQEDFLTTDDAALLEHCGIPVKVVPGSVNNIKLTAPEDLPRARTILGGAVSSMRVGYGYDVHRLVPERDLILCGVSVPYELGLLGHSDADVALHALMDAMLGACALGDIGAHFPDTDERYRGVSSLLLLKETVRILAEAGYRVYNADVTIVAQKPKLLSYIPRMKETVAETLSLPVSFVSVKATTTERLGFEGRMEGISASAVCTVTEIEG